MRDRLDRVSYLLLVLGWVSAVIAFRNLDRLRAELRACREGGAPPIAVEFVRVAP